MDHSENERIDDEDNDKKPMASSSTMPIPPSFSNPVNTNNLLSRLQNFLPQLEAANRGKARCVNPCNILIFSALMMDVFASLRFSVHGLRIALEKEAAEAETSLSGSKKRRTIDVDLCRQSEDESSSSSSDSDGDSSDDDSSAEGNEMLDSKSESNLLTPVVTTSKRRRADEATISTKAVATSDDDHVEATSNGGSCSKDGTNTAMLPKAGAPASMTNLGDSDTDGDGDVPTHHHQQQQEEESDQPMIQIQFVMGSNLEEQHPAAMALLADNESNSSSSDNDNDEDSDSSDEDDVKNAEPTGATADSKTNSERLSAVKQLLLEESTSSSKKDIESNQRACNSRSKPQITELK